MPDAPDPAYALFDIPRHAATFWEAVKLIDEYVVGGGAVVVTDPMRRAWAEFHTEAAAYVMRKACPVEGSRS